MFLAALLITVGSAAKAQVATGGNYKLEQSVIAGGGGTSTDAANTFSVTGTIGQPAAGTVTSNSPFSQLGGFWAWLEAALMVDAPTISKTFSPASITVNGTSIVTLTLTKNSSSSQTNASFTDALSNMTTAGGSVSGTCTGTNPSTLSSGETALSFTGITIPAAGSCTVMFSVTSNAAGAHPNTTSGVTSAQTTVAGAASNTATLTVVAAPTITKAFSPSAINTGGVSTLIITFTNPSANTVALTGVAVTDAFPSGLTVDSTPSAINSCGGTFTAIADASNVSLSGASIPVGGSCTVSVNVKATTVGQKINTTGAVSSSNGGTGTTASATLTVTSVAPNIEGDVNPRPAQTGNPNPGQSGDGVVTSGDVTQIRRFVLSLDVPDISVNEFQKADTAAYNTKGDGSINAGDVTQIRRYALSLDPPTNAAGPTVPNPPNQPTFAKEESEPATSDKQSESVNQLAPQTTRSLNVVRTNLAGNVLTVALQLNTDASKTGATAFNAELNYDTNVLSNPTNVRPVPGAAGTGGTGTGGTTASTSGNTIDADTFRVLADLPPPQTFGLGQQNIVLVDFTVAAGATGTTTISLSNIFVSDAFGNSLATTTTPSQILVGPTAAQSEIKGRVLTANGRAVSKAKVILTNQNGEIRTVLTNAFGYYRIEEIASGETYIISAEHKQYTFETKVITVYENLSDIDLIAAEKPSNKNNQKDTR